MSKQFWGKGLAQALTKILVQKAKSDRKSAIIKCSPEQEATKHIAEKLEFRYAGLIDGCDVYKLDF